MSKPAFYYDGQLLAGALGRLPDEEAAHARVLRVKPGDKIEIFDGCGGQAEAKVISADKRAISIEIGIPSHTPRPDAPAIMALAMSKAVRRDFFMEKAAELGASEIWLWEAARSVGHISEGAMKGCQKQLAAGAKQSRNPWFANLRNVKNLDGVINACTEIGVNWRILPWEDQDRQAIITPAQLGRPGTSLYVIGPEGGFTPEEVARFKEENFSLVSLGRQVLRCETAATLCLGLHAWAAQLAGRLAGK